ncbi:hypothetical protein OG555_36930 [Kribbella sp. NBC_01484]|uniref:hypothetical protein n=1 Tax=Kribbella sp. NBC_01484 TaxID=2903579 RepID=UPI002E2FA005|nr:hypothetical protein [Kribbella sp. NBC_01484]
MIVLTEHRVGQRFVGVQPGDFGWITRILRGELAKLQHLQRLHRLGFLHARQSLDDPGISL